MKIVIHGYRFCRDSDAGGTKNSTHWLAEQLAALIPADFRREKIGLYLATAVAAVDVSVSFWQEALAEGVDFVNPRDFHWTLASSPAVQAAMMAELRGPVQTLIGGGEAELAAIFHGIHALENREIDLAVVGTLNPGGGLEHSAAAPAALITLGRAEDQAIGYIGLIKQESGIETRECAVVPLSGICLALEEGNSAVVSAPYERAYRIAPAR